MANFKVDGPKPHVNHFSIITTWILDKERFNSCIKHMHTLEVLLIIFADCGLLLVAWQVVLFWVVSQLP